MINYYIPENKSNRFLNLTEEDNLLFLLYNEDSEYYSHLHISARTESKFIGLAATTRTDSFDIMDYLENGLPIYTDLYITPNGMKSEYSRKENLLSIQNLIIDIDCHKENTNLKSIDQFANELTNHLTVKPNAINFTGRGMHLWYRIEPCHVKLRKICLSVLDIIEQEIEEQIDDLNAKYKTEMTLDKSSSNKLNGLFRIPYSWNTKTNTWSELKFIHKEIKNINELKKALNATSKKAEYIKDKEKPNKRPKFINLNSETNDYTPALMHRIKFLKMLIAGGKVLEGRRQNVLFALFNTTMQLYGNEEAEETTIKYNNLLSDPIPYSQLLSMFKGKKYNRITNNGFLKLINATKEEIKEFSKLTKKELERIAKREAKAKKYDEIKTLYINGKTITEINKLTGISRPTIYKVIKE